MQADLNILVVESDQDKAREIIDALTDGGWKNVSVIASAGGLERALQKQPSWSALRDRLAFGHIDFAHMLSPMPVAISLGLGGMPNRIDALMVLLVNGTVIAGGFG